MVTNYLPFDAYRLAWEPSQLLYLSLYYLSLTIPFFFGGLVIGIALSVQSERAGSTYAVNLLGSGLGPPLALLALATVGGPGAVIFCTFLGWLAVVAAQGSVIREERFVKRPIQRWLKIAGYSAITIILLSLTLYPPSLFEVRLTPYKSLSQAQLYPGSEVVFRQWNAISRVDVLQSEGIRSAPGLSFTYPDALPPQLGLVIDGDNLVPMSGPDQARFTGYLPLSLAFQLRPQANTLILEPGGGLAVLTAREHEAGPITVVQSNPTALAVVREYAGDDKGKLYDDPDLTLIIGEPRSFLRPNSPAI